MKQKKILISAVSLLVVSMGAVFSASVASAEPNDVVLSRIVTGTSEEQRAVSSVQFKSITKDLAAIMAPGHFSGANTLGQEGFEFSAQTRFSFAKKAPGWITLQRNKGMEPTGQQKYKVDSSDGKTTGGEREVDIPNFTPPKFFATAQIQARKGLPFGLEINGFANWLAESSMFMVGAGVGMSLVEGFRYVPDITVRGNAGFLLGSRDLNLIAVNAELNISYPFGIAGNARLTPYGGYNFGYVVSSSRSQNLPSASAKNSGGTPADSKGRQDFVFSQYRQQEHTGFVGLELKADYFIMSVEGIFGKNIMSAGAKIGTAF